MATIGDLMGWATHEDGLKTYLGVSGTSEDTLLQLYLEAMIELADDYIEEPDLVTLPKRLELGVYMGVYALRNRRKKDGLNAATTFGLAEQYAAAFAGDAAFQAARLMLTQTKKRRWLDGRR